MGLVARVIESAGIPTVTVNMMPAYQALVGMPRIAAVAHPLGRPWGDVGDVERQSAVLRGALGVAETARQPGTVVHLPFVWHQNPKDTKWEPDEPSPIVAMMKESGVF